MGRPAGGIATLISRKFITNARVLLNTDCYMIVEFAGVLLANVYLPCAGSDNRLAVCLEILSDIGFLSKFC